MHLARHACVTDTYGERMTPIDPSGTREFLESLIAGFSVLGGVMAYYSGHAAHRAIAHDGSPPAVAHAINEGIGEGFETGTPAAIMTLMIMGWS